MYMKLVEYLKNSNEPTILVMFGDHLPSINGFKLYKDSDIYKTGLYVKDQINGIGTLTYIDPNTKIFGALGHEIAEKTTMKKEKNNTYKF